MDDPEERKRRLRQLGVDIGVALEKAGVQKPERPEVLLEAAYALAAGEGWSFEQLCERSYNVFHEQVRLGRQGQTIQIVSEMPEGLRQ